MQLAVFKDIQLFLVDSFNLSDVKSGADAKARLVSLDFKVSSLSVPFFSLCSLCVTFGVNIGRGHSRVTMYGTFAFRYQFFSFFPRFFFG